MIEHDWIDCNEIEMKDWNEWKKKYSFMFNCRNDSLCLYI